MNSFMEKKERYDQSTEEARMPTTLFQTLYDYDVSPLTQQIQGRGFSPKYIPWATAWATFKRLVPDATYSIAQFDKLPYLKTECGYFVQVIVTAGGVSETEIFPVTNNNFEAIKEPDARDIADAHQRGLVKCLARHGFGLSLWEKEPVKTGDETPSGSTKIIEKSQLSSHKTKAILNGDVGNPGDHQITFGKNENLYGRKLKDCDQKELSGFIAWLKKQTKLSKDAVVLIEKYEEWQQLKNSEDIPF